MNRRSKPRGGRAHPPPEAKQGVDTQVGASKGQESKAPAHNTLQSTSHTETHATRTAYDKDEAEIWLARHRIYREEDRHECNLLSSRINALLYSQGFLVVGAVEAFHYQHFWVFLIIAVPAFLLVAVTSFAVSMGCQVLREWHRHGGKVVREARGKTGVVFDYCLLAQREKGMPDAAHWWSIDVFNLTIPLFLGAGWLLAIDRVAVQRLNSVVALMICLGVGVGWMFFVLLAFAVPYGLHLSGPRMRLGSRLRNCFSDPFSRKTEENLP